MTMRAKLRLLTAALLSALLGITLVAPAEAKPRHRWPDRIELPVGFLPEGITIGKAPVAYLGSRADGDILAVDLKTGERKIVSEGPGPGNPSVGLKIDRRGLLYVAGGTAGTGRVVSARTGEIFASYNFTSLRPSFVNDVVLSDRYAWFTDSSNPQLYRVERTRNGKRAQRAEVKTVPLRGDWAQLPDVNNANGIAADARRPRAAGHQLHAQVSCSGSTRAPESRSRSTSAAPSLTNGDGLLLKGRTLYVVRNRLNLIEVVHLDRRGTEGEVVETLTSPDFDVPTTVAAYKGSLYLPNARFGTITAPQTPETADYWITRIDR